MDGAGDGEETLYELTDLDVEAIGLVRRGANRRPFYVLKSENGGNEMEREHQEEQEFSDILQQLEKVEEMNESAWSKLVEAFGALAERIGQPIKGEILDTVEPEQFAEMSAADKKVLAAAMKLGKGKLGERLYSMLEKLVGGNPGGGDEKKEYGYPPEKEKMSEEFTEQLKEVEERFAEQLKVAEAKAEQAQKRADEERHLRRLAEFTERARGYAFAVGEVEKFAEDMLKLNDQDAELYARMEARLKALDEQVRQGALFEQFSVAGGETDAGVHPFLREVEKLRKEHYPTEAYAEGFTKAMELAEQMEPELAARYERETREV